MRRRARGYVPAGNCRKVQDRIEEALAMDTPDSRLALAVQAMGWQEKPERKFKVNMGNQRI